MPKIRPKIGNKKDIGGQNQWSIIFIFLDDVWKLKTCSYNMDLSTNPKL